MRSLVIGFGVLGLALALSAEEGFHEYENRGHDENPLIPGTTWKVHDNTRPQPPRVMPGEFDAGATEVPSDAIVLFDGTSLDRFGKTEWKIVDGHVVAGKGSLTTRQTFGDCQLHVEWRAPVPVVPVKKASNMGNSGIFFMWQYELQIFDSYSCKIYADGSAAAIYGQTPPLVNVCRKPGEWQTYDIHFTAPAFEGEKLIKPARITVHHNGVLVQNDTEILGKTRHNTVPAYKAHPARGQIGFQGHGSPVEYRNIWIRDLEGESQE